METIKPYDPEAVTEDIYERAFQTMVKVLDSLPTLIRIVDSLILDQPSFGAVVLLLEWPYWQRIWIVQEIILSPKAIVFCGNSHVEFQYIKLFYLITSGVLLALSAVLGGAWILIGYSLTSITGRIFFESSETRNLQWLIEKRLSIFTTAKPKQEITDLEWRLLQTTHYQATNPRDKLYGILGLDRQKSFLIQPDYNQDVGQVYADFVHHALRIDKLLFSGTNGVGYRKPEPSPIMPSIHKLLLSVAKSVGYHKPVPSSGMPSWVPDLQTSGNPQLADIESNFGEFIKCEGIERLRFMGVSRVHAAGVSKPRVNMSDDLRILKAEGVAIDHIEAFEPPGYAPDPSTIASQVTSTTASQARSQIRWHKLVRDHSKVSHPTGLPRMQAYFRTLVFDSGKSLTEKACGFLTSFEFLGLPIEEWPAVLAEAINSSRTEKGPSWFRRLNYILEFLRNNQEIWFLRFLILSGEIDSIVDSIQDDGRGDFLPLSTRQLLQGFYGPTGATVNSDLKYLAVGEDITKYLIQYTQAAVNTQGR